MNNRDKELHVTADQLKESGYQAFQQKDHQKAVALWQEAIQLIRQMVEPDLHLKGKLLFNLGLTHSKLGRDEDAIHYYLEAVELAVPEESSCFSGKAYMGMGQSYRKLNDFENAVACTEQAIAIFQRQDDPLMAERVRVNCGVLYRELGRMEQAKAILESSLAAFTAWNCTEEAKVVTDQLKEIRKKQMTV